RTQCRNAKSFALTEGDVTIQAHYGYLRSYAKALVDSNEGSTVKVGVTVNPDEITYFDRIVHTKRGDGVAIIKRRRQDFQSDDVMNLATASGRSRLKVADDIK
ncbi:hypothetical protein Tco_0250141, partial [Tanacetum coccineum]